MAVRDSDREDPAAKGKSALAQARRELASRIELARFAQFLPARRWSRACLPTTSARTGQWVRGPGPGFFRAVGRELGTLPFIAEDLGLITPDVIALREKFRLPGMRVLQFAFDGKADNPHLPDNYVANSVVYTGTHDNATTRGWYEALPATEQLRVWNGLGRSRGAASEVAPALMRLAWESVAALAIAPLQDLLNLGDEARMYVPGRTDGNWRWRCTEEMLSARAFEWLRDLTNGSGRSEGESVVPVA